MLAEKWMPPYKKQICTPFHLFFFCCALLFPLTPLYGAQLPNPAADNFQASLHVPPVDEVYIEKPTRGKKITGDCFYTIRKALIKWQDSVEVLDASGSDIDLYEAAEILALLVDVPNIQIIDLSSNEIGKYVANQYCESKFYRMLEKVVKKPTVTAINLADNPIVDEDYIYQKDWFYDLKEHLKGGGNYEKIKMPEQDSTDEEDSTDGSGF